MQICYYGYNGVVSLKKKLEKCEEYMEELLSQALPFWKDLTDREQYELIQKTEIEDYKKGIVIHVGSSECAGVQIVKKGQIRTYITSPSGGEITLFRLVEGDVSILSAACMLRGMNIEMDMQMEEDSVLYTIPKALYKKLSDGNTKVKDYTMEMVSEKFSDVIWLFNQYVFSNSASRLAGVILEHRALAGSNLIEITHDTLARDLGTAREVVSRLLKQFQIDGYVKLTRGHIEVIDVEALLKV